MHPKIVGAEDWPEMPESEGRGPASVAPAVVYFASEESRLCNGTELVLDGGQTAGQAIPLPDSLYGIASPS
jgi:NAD(P)-dependent dehydrogenase (short-subunit alcohol dehydrogenase family)